MNDPKTDAWMPLWIGAYLADTMKLTTLQHGAYFLLLMSYWRERAPLQDDDEELRSITKTDKAEWKRIRPVLARYFTISNGVWWHKRVEHEMAEADARQEAASKKAKAGAEARWGKSRKHASGNASSIPQALPEDTPKECTTPSPITSSLRSEDKPRKRSEPAIAKPEGVDDQTWSDWLQLRKAKKAPVTATVLAQAQAEACKAEMPLEAFLRVWCSRGSQGLQADWLKPNERQQHETPYQRSMREKYETIAPAVAAKKPGTVDPNSFFDALPAVKPLEISHE